MPIKNYEEWEAAVKKAYPDEASKIQFKGRIEQGKDTISAEIPGKDRSYGVWDSDKDEGTVLTAAFLIEARLNDPILAAGVPGKYVVYYFEGSKQQKSPQAMTRNEALDFMTDISKTTKQPAGHPWAVTKGADGSTEKYTLNQLKLVHSSAEIESRIKPNEDYAWFTFTGKGFDGMNEAQRTVSLETGDRFGVRKSSDGKKIRLITEKDGPNKVYTCDLPTAQYLAKKCKPAQASVETAAKPKLSKTFKQLEKVMQELGYATSKTWTLMNPGYPVTAWECGESTDTVTKLLTSKISGLTRDQKQFKGHINFTGDDKTLVQVFVDKRKTIISCPAL
jgi:hypothetical protein